MVGSRMGRISQLPRWNSTSRRRKIPILVFLIHRGHPITIDQVEVSDTAREKLASLKARASKGRIRAEFKSPEDLRGLVIHALAELEKQQEESAGEKKPPSFHPPNLIPTAPAPYIAHPYSVLQTRKVVGRREELQWLTDWVTTNTSVSRDVRLFSVVAIGGMGKSALTWKWFNDIAPNELPNLAGRMWWSFYESDAYFENFVIRALAYAAGLPEADVRQMPAPERENQLWHVLDQRPFLLVLDGLERILLAYAPWTPRTCRMMTWTSRPLTTSPGSTACRTTSRRPIWKLRCGKVDIGTL